MIRDEESIFESALGTADQGERAAYLDRVCDGDANLRKSVEALLSAYDAGAFLEEPIVVRLLNCEAASAYEPGSRVGPFRLLEQIGEGGMGLVFVAEQSSPVKRRVALKFIKPGMDTRQVIARFEAERQVLALMDHPNIARVFDGGITPEGRPYFVMELVRLMTGMTRANGGGMGMWCAVGTCADEFR